MNPRIHCAFLELNVGDLAATAIPSRKAYRTVDAHYWATLLVVAALAPALRLAGLPFRFAWAEFFQVYWGFLVAEAVVGGLILYIVGVPITESLGPMFRRYSRQKMRFVFILPLIPILMLTLGIRAGLMVFVATIVMLEVKERAEENQISLLKMTADLFWPTAYLFVGVVVVSAYNEAIATVRYDGATEFLLSRWDSVLLGGHSVSGFAHAFLGRWPGSIPWMELIYFGTFAQTGGCLAILALRVGRYRALQYVGTILFAFYIALAFFYVWPAAGPFASCANHFSAVPNGHVIYDLQRYMLVNLERLRSGLTSGAIGPAYYIALPSMHMVQALISLWFLRRWKRLLILAIVFDALLVLAILVLENHYLVDLIAAVPVAVLAITLSGRNPLTLSPTHAV